MKKILLIIVSVFFIAHAATAGDMECQIYLKNKTLLTCNVEKTKNYGIIIKNNRTILYSVISIIKTKDKNLVAKLNEKVKNISIKSEDEVFVIDFSNAILIKRKVDLFSPIKYHFVDIFVSSEKRSFFNTNISFSPWFAKLFLIKIGFNTGGIENNRIENFGYSIGAGTFNNFYKNNQIQMTINYTINSRISYKDGLDFELNYRYDLLNSKIWLMSGIKYIMQKKAIDDRQDVNFQLGLGINIKKSHK